MVIATLAAALVFYLPGHLPPLGRSAAWAAGFAANIWFMKSLDYFTAPADAAPLLHLWSLGVEEQFYLVAPALLAFMARRPGKRAWRLAAGLCALSFLGCVAATWTFPRSAFYLLPTRFWELGLGMMLAWAPPGAVDAALAGRRRQAASIAGLALILGSVALLDEGMRFPGVIALAPCLGAALVIAAGPDTVGGRLLALRPLVLVGLVSYALYLWHWPVLAYARTWAMQDYGTGWALGALALSGLLATLTLVLVERPLRRARWGSPRRTLLVGGGVLATLFVLGMGLARTDGFPSRWSDGALALSEGRAPGAAAAPEAPGTCVRAAFGVRAAFVSCALGAPGDRPDFIVWGDSHAGALVPGLERAAAARGLSGYVLSANGCAPLPGVAWAANGLRRPCLAFNRDMEALVARLRPRAVLLAGRWDHVAASFPGGDASLAGTRPLHPVGPSLVGAPPPFADALAAAVGAVRAAGAVPLVLLQPPEPPHRVASVAARAFEWGREPPGGVARAAHAARGAAMRAALKALEAQAPGGGGVVALDPAEALCGPLDCPAFDGATPIYRDTNHLTRHGALMLAPMLGEGLVDALRLQAGGGGAS
ncbi:acyltransferase family protein [Rhodovulum sp. DZ06]|uniref:acyltransferase family protein n=1 Tax=Rhodovulum sp. DZ06 TaxID=3425126 RepID=UPI003D3359CA